MKGNFQLIIIIVFIACAVLGVLVFAGVVPIGAAKKVNPLQGNVTLWGTESTTAMNPLISAFNTANPTVILKYVQKFPETFNQDLLEALASGVGPDLFILPDNLAYSYSDKIYPIPYTNYPLVNFKSVYASAGEVFLTQKGILALPLSIDPLMMYYNRDTLNANNIVYPPSSWDEFLEMVSKMTLKDDTNQIVKSAVALGQFSNVTNAKDILATLFMQSGNPIVSQKEGGYFTTTFGDTEDDYSDLSPVLSFYTNFADPLKKTYSWNKSLPPSRDFFSADKLAFYFGFASELQDLINKNPNQNFAVAPIPQVKNGNLKATNAHVNGIAVSAFSKNLATSYGVAALLASGDFAKNYVALLGVAPARRDLLALKPEDDYYPIIYSSALISKSWLDPSPIDSDNVFRLMVDGVLSNSLTPKEAINQASGRLNLLLR